MRVRLGLYLEGVALSGFEVLKPDARVVVVELGHVVVVAGLEQEFNHRRAILMRCHPAHLGGGAGLRVGVEG